MFQPGNPERDIQWSVARDGSDESLTSASPYDCCGFGKDYEPLPFFCKSSDSGPAEETADSYLKTNSSIGRGAYPPDAGEDH